jgi:hypothetical protein
VDVLLGHDAVVGQVQGGQLRALCEPALRNVHNLIEGQIQCLDVGETAGVKPL